MSHTFSIICIKLSDVYKRQVYDINSPGESTRIISKLMQWTDDRQIHIHTILHQNKGDENARGPVSYTHLDVYKRQSASWYCAP